MKANMTRAMETADASRLERAFTRLADLGPLDDASWRSIASRGAAAASRGDVEAVRQACKQCHDEHRAHHRRQARERPLPP
jgi:hypothetical protein